MAEPQAYEPVSQRGNRCSLQALLGGRLQLFRIGSDSKKRNLVGSIFSGQQQAVHLHQYWAQLIGLVPCSRRWTQKVSMKVSTETQVSKKSCK